jgi:hypothetical protein
MSPLPISSFVRVFIVVARTARPPLLRGLHASRCCMDHTPPGLAAARVADLEDQVRLLEVAGASKVNATHRAIRGL